MIVLQKQGHYIQDWRLVFNSGCQQKLIEHLKNKQKDTWTNIAKRVGVSEYTLRISWRLEKNTLPLAHAKKIANLSSQNWDDVMDSVLVVFEKNWGQKQRKKGVGLKKIFIPSIENPKLAEFLGILLSDGYVSKYFVEICGDARFDQHYLTQYVPKLVLDLFGLNGTLRTQENTLRLRFCSKKMSEWIVETFGLPYGKKIYCVSRIPKAFFADAIKLSACIRGCVDTDGGIYRFHDRAGVAFFNENKMFLEDVAFGLRQLGFSPYFTKGKEVWLLKKRDVLLYLSQIGTSNLKNVIRVLEWKRNGIFPLLAEVLQLLNKGINVELPYIETGPVV